ncbi:MAG: hypothetical protein GF350_17390 [Chitinivibrionales bacterium]|nr:hypothetical protein [Chitinivibrionales bacterium]
MNDLIEIFEAARFGTEKAAREVSDRLSPELRKLRDKLESSVKAEQAARDMARKQIQTAKTEAATYEEPSVSQKAVRSLIPGSTYGGVGALPHALSGAAGAGAGAAMQRGTVAGRLLPFFGRRAASRAAHLLEAGKPEVLLSETKGVMPEVMKYLGRAAPKSEKQVGQALAKRILGVVPRGWKAGAGLGALAGLALPALVNLRRSGQVAEMGGEAAVRAREKAKQLLEEAKRQRQWRESEAEKVLPTLK